MLPLRVTVHAGHKLTHTAEQALSYTPWPVPPSAPGERLRIAVGPLKDKNMRTYLFKK